MKGTPTSDLEGLTDEELAEVPPLTNKEIEEAFREGRDALELEEKAAHTMLLCPGLSFR